ncbi:MAG: hypothetical protein LBR80_06825 [Deltaproteobacteria bacterium]|nr:hypothetical protein [Deltaproteobacteria bacterium]
MPRRRRGEIPRRAGLGRPRAAGAIEGEPTSEARVRSVAYKAWVYSTSEAVDIDWRCDGAPGDA